MNPVFWILVRKHMYLMRMLSIATVVVGLLALFLFRFGNVGFAIGGILFLTVNVASGLFIVSFTVLQDRKDQSRMFALSLPVSGRQFELAKFTGACLAFGIPWLILTAAATTLFLLPPSAHDRALFVYALLIQLCVLAIDFLFLGIMFAVQSEAIVGLVILGVNMIFSLFMVTINQPPYIGKLRGPVINWPPFAVTTLLVELLVIVLSTVLALAMLSRRRDYI